MTHHALPVLLFVCLCGSACRSFGASFAWDTLLTVTSTPFGTGTATWRSPEPIPADEPGYSCTGIYPVAATLFSPAIVDLGGSLLSFATNTGPLSGLPHTFFMRSASLTTELAAPLGTITAVMQYQSSCVLGTDAHVRVAISNLYARDITHQQDLGMALALIARTNEGFGTYIHTLPEPCATAAGAALALLLRRSFASPHGGLS